MARLYRQNFVGLHTWQLFMYDRIMRLNILRSIPVFFSVISLAAVIFYNYFLPDNQPEEFLPEEEYREEVVINYVYKIPSDSFRIEKSKVKRNQTLSGVLSGIGVPDGAIHRLVIEAKGILDVRQFRAGNHYTYCINQTVLIVRHTSFMKRIL